MTNMLDGLGIEASILDGLLDWPSSASLRSGLWFAITRRIVQDTISDIDLNPVALVEVEEAFIGAGLL